MKKKRNDQNQYLNENFATTENKDLQNEEMRTISEKFAPSEPNEGDEYMFPYWEEFTTKDEK